MSRVEGMVIKWMEGHHAPFHARSSCQRAQRTVQPAFFGRRVQKMSEKVSPAKKVDAARAECPVRMLNTADAVQHAMITMINMMIRERRR